MPDAADIFNASVQALGPADTLAQINIISAVADCTAPRGTYITEVHSGRGGRVWFKQSWANRTPYVVIITPDRAWATDTVTGATETLDAESISMVRGHEFQMIPLTLAERLTDAQPGGEREWNGANYVTVTARDDLNLPCTLFFRADDMRWAGTEITDPLRQGGQVTVVVDSWTRVDDLLLPSKVKASDAGGDYVLDFHTITLNSADDSIFTPPSYPSAI